VTCWKPQHFSKFDLAAVEEIPADSRFPVQINAVVTELGNLELWMKHTNRIAAEGRIPGPDRIAGKRAA